MEITKTTNDTAIDPFGRMFHRIHSGLWQDSRGNVYKVVETRATLFLQEKVNA